MAAFTHSTPVPVFAGGARRASNPLGFLDLWAKRMTYRAEMRALTERQIEDIGLTVGDVEDETNKPFWRA